MSVVERTQQLEERLRAVQHVEELSTRVAQARRQADRLEAAVQSLASAWPPIEELAGEGLSLGSSELASAREAFEETERCMDELSQEATEVAPNDIASLVARLEGLVSGLQSWPKWKKPGDLSYRERTSRLSMKNFIAKLEDAGFDVGELDTAISGARPASRA